MQKTVLNVGCGHRKLRRLHPHFQGPDWQEVRLDVDPGMEPDIVCSITDMKPIQDCSIDAIWSSHNLEHLYRHEVPQAFREFMRVLRPNGLLLVTLPDLQRVAELVAEDKAEEQAYLSPSGPVTPLDMMFGHGVSLAHGNFNMAHKGGFTANSLLRQLVAAGFAEAVVHRGDAYDLWASAQKPAS